MAKIKNTYTPETKAKIVLDGLSYPDGIASYCRKIGIKDTLFYKWKNQLIVGAKEVFKPHKKESSEEIKLREQLTKKDKIISELVEENLSLKKFTGV